MVEYNKVNARLSDSQLNKLKSAVKNQTGVALRMNIIYGSNLHHKLLLTTRQTTKLRNAIKINMSTDIKLPRAQISKIIHLVHCSLGNKYFSSVRNNSCCFSN